MHLLMFFYIFVASNNIQLKGGRQLLYSRLFGFFSPQCNGLSLAVHKTEAVRISSRRSRRKYCTSRFKQHLVKPVYQVSRGTDQPKTVLQNSPWICTRKSIKMNEAVSRIMPNTRGQKLHSRRIMATMVTLTILYSAHI